MTTTTLTSRTTTAVVDRRTLSKYATEAVGTTFLVFTIGAATAAANPLAPLAIGAVLIAMIYAGGHISGAHYNPAVTIAALVRGRINRREAAGYWVAQAGGALLAAALVAIVSPAHTAPMHLDGHAMVAASTAELLFTFALCYVVLNVATSKDHPDNSFYGLAIGLVVIAGAVSVGSICGASFNPAVVLGGLAMGTISTSLALPYLVAQALAGVAAGLAFRALNSDDT